LQLTRKLDLLCCVVSNSDEARDLDQTKGNSGITWAATSAPQHHRGSVPVRPAKTRNKHNASNETAQTKKRPTHLSKGARVDPASVIGTTHIVKGELKPAPVLLTRWVGGYLGSLWGARDSTEDGKRVQAFLHVFRLERTSGDVILREWGVVLLLRCVCGTSKRHP
jgi:hypothetical protein